LAIISVAAKRAIALLEPLGIVHETTGRQRGRLFVYGPYLDLLREGTEPESPQENRPTEAN
jgi:hypothetical protein